MAVNSANKVQNGLTAAIAAAAIAAAAIAAAAAAAIAAAAIGLGRSFQTCSEKMAVNMVLLWIQRLVTICRRVVVRLQNQEVPVRVHEPICSADVARSDIECSGPNLIWLSASQGH